MKKIMQLLTSIAMVFVLFPSMGLTDVKAADAIRLSAASVSIDNKPTVGAAVDSVVFSKASDANFKVSSVTWAVQGSTDVLKSSDIFEGSKIYVATVTLTPIFGYLFNEGTPATQVSLTGNSEISSPDAESTTVTDGGATLTFKVTFPSTESGLIQGTLPITVNKAPVYNASDNTVTFSAGSDAGYSVTSVKWNPLVNYVFQSNTVYTVTVMLSAGSGRSFDTTGVTINLQQTEPAATLTATNLQISSDQQTLTFQAVFPATAQDDQYIYTAALSISALPSAGTAIADVAITPKDGSTGYTVDSLTWNPTIEGSVFAENVSYTATVTLKAADGKTFIDKPYITLQLGDVSESVSNIVLSSDNKTLTFTALAPKTETSAVTVSLNKLPQTGGNPNNAMFFPASGEAYSVFTTWMDASNNTLAEGTYFEAGKEYTASVLVIYNESANTVFTENTSVTLAGAASTLQCATKKLDSATQLHFTVKCPAPTSSVQQITNVPIHFSVGPDGGINGSTVKIADTEQYSVKSMIGGLEGNSVLNYNSTYYEDVVLEPKTGYEFDYNSKLNFTFSGTSSSVTVNYAWNNLDINNNPADNNLRLNLRIATEKGATGQIAEKPRTDACSISYVNSADPLYKITCTDGIISRFIAYKNNTTYFMGNLMLYPLDANGNADLTSNNIQTWSISATTSITSGTSYTFRKSQIGYINKYDTAGNATKVAIPTTKYGMVLHVADEEDQPTADHFYLVSGAESVLFGTDTRLGYSEDNIDKTSCQILPGSDRSTDVNSSDITCTNKDAMNLLNSRLSTSENTMNDVRLLLKNNQLTTGYPFTLSISGNYDSTTGVYHVYGKTFVSSFESFTTSDYYVELQIVDSNGLTHYYKLSDSLALENTKVNPGTINSSFDSTTGDLILACATDTEACRKWVAAVEKSPKIIYFGWSGDWYGLYSGSSEAGSDGVLSAASDSTKVVYDASFLAKYGIYPATDKYFYYSFYMDGFTMITGTVSSTVPNLPVYAANTPQDLKGSFAAPTVDTSGDISITCTPSESTQPDDAHGCIAFADKLTRFWGIETEPYRYDYNGSIPAENYTVTKDAVSGSVTYKLSGNYYKDKMQAQDGTFKFVFESDKFNKITTGTVNLTGLNQECPSDAAIYITGDGVVLASKNETYISNVVSMTTYIQLSNYSTYTGNPEQVFTKSSGDVVIQSPTDNGTKGNQELWSALIPIEKLINHGIAGTATYTISVNSSGFTPLPIKVYSVAKIINVLNAAKEVQRNSSAVTTEALTSLDEKVANLDSVNVSTVVEDKTAENISLTGVGSLTTLSDTDGKLTSTDLGSISGATNVAVNVTATDNTLTTTETSNIKSLVGSDAMLDDSFNVQITKQVDSGTSTEVKELCAPSAITFDLSDDTKNALKNTDTEVVLVREHEATDTTTELSVLPVTVSTDGTSATAYSDKFSGFTPVVMDKAKADALIAQSVGNTISGSVSCWMDMSKDQIRLYPGSMSDSDIKTDLMSFTPSQYLKANPAITDISAPVADTSRGVQNFKFTNLEAGTYKVAVYTTGGNTVKISDPITVSDTNKTPATGTLKQWRYGDVNDDDEIDQFDAIEVMKYALSRKNNKITTTLTNSNDQGVVAAADVVQDNEVDAFDAIEIMKKALNKTNNAIDKLK